jgi:hypothetical protein
MFQCCHEEDTESRSANLTAVLLNSQDLYQTHHPALAAKLQPASTYNHQPSSPLAAQNQPALSLAAEHKPVLPLAAGHRPALLLASQYQAASPLAAQYQPAAEAAVQPQPIVKGVHRHFLDSAAMAESGENRKVPHLSPVNKELGYFAERQAIKGKKIL